MLKLSAVEIDREIEGVESRQQEAVWRVYVHPSIGKRMAPWASCGFFTPNERPVFFDYRTPVDEVRFEGLRGVIARMTASV